jgi:NADPH-dependent 2,4-dienoyl-CoA reductase/sulfur reductase-like enzyme
MAEKEPSLRFWRISTMPEYKYLIVGGGMTCDAAIRGIRQTDHANRIGIITSEKYPPYKRPPLSKALWKNEPLEKIWLNSYEEDIEIHTSRTVTMIDTRNHTVLDDLGKVYSYQKLLLATGGTVRRLPWNVDGIMYFRTLDDYYSLREMIRERKTIAVIGGGFIGSEIAAALALNDVSVTMVFPETGIGSRVFPPELSGYITNYYRSKNVEVLAGNSVVNLMKQNQKYLLTTSGGTSITVDGIVCGIGIQPNVTLATMAGLAVENGIIVNEFLQTSQPDVFAAGDVANFYSPVLEKNIRLEHEDNAVVMGKHAGRNMAGDSVRYHHLPFFYSDLFDLGYEAVGELDTRYEIIEDWAEPYREGVVYYIHEKHIRGVLLWNTWGQIDAARALIAEKGPFNSVNVIGRLPA